MKSIVINIMDCVDGTSTNVDGFKLYNAMEKAIRRGYKIKLSLADVTPMSSSFLNSSIGELIEFFGLDTFKKRVSLVNYKPSYANMIVSYINKLERYA